MERKQNSIQRTRNVNLNAVYLRMKSKMICSHLFSCEQIITSCEREIARRGRELNNQNFKRINFSQYKKFDLFYSKFNFIKNNRKFGCCLFMGLTYSTVLGGKHVISC